MIYFKKDSLQYEDLLTLYEDSNYLDRFNKLLLKRSWIVEDYTVYRYQQYYGGVPVDVANTTVTTDNGEVRMISGTIAD